MPEMTAEERAKSFIESLLISIHWNGERSEHPHDVKWLAARVKQLIPSVMPFLLAAQREAEERMRERCILAVGAGQNGAVGAYIRALPSEYGEDK